MSLGEREDELLDTLEAVIDADLPYVLVGGWAIAAFNRIATHLHRGASEKLAGRIETVLDRLTSEDFADAFKRVFEQQTVPEQDIDAVVKFLRDQQRRIDSES